jgi:HEAT repeat protein
MRVKGTANAISALLLLIAAPAAAQGWVQSLVELRPAPGDLRDGREPLARRIAEARALGEFGAPSEAVPSLLAALGDQPLPAPLRDEVLLALARLAPPEAAAPLALMLAREDTPPTALVVALGAIGTEQAIAALGTALALPSAAHAAEQGLILAGQRAAAPLARALESGVAVRAANVLAALGPAAADAALPALVNALHSEAPELRAAAARALGALGDERAAEALLALAADPAPAVVHAAFEALAHVAKPSQARALLARLRAVAVADRPLVLAALASADPELATPELERALHGEQSALREAALALLEGEHPHPSWAGLLAALYGEQQREATASALARVAKGAGLALLCARAAASPEALEHAARALAIGLRRFRAELSGSVVREAERLLRSVGGTERALFLRALARDGSVRQAVRLGLAASELSMRATSAAGATLLGDAALAPAVSKALEGERDPETARRLLEAAAELHASASQAVLSRLMADPETAPEAMLLATRLVDPVAPPRSLRTGLRRALSSQTEQRVRATAALALGRLGDQAARPSLIAALDDASARIRLAAVRALGAIGGTASANALRAAARVERDALVRRAALQELAHAGVPAWPEHGELTLELRVLQQDAALGARPLCDVLLEDGRWLRQRVRSGGELVIADLARGLADVRVLD